MPPILRLDHSNPYLNYLNPAVNPSGPFTVGSATTITISIQNTGSETGNANVHLYWIGPMQSSSAGPMMDLVGCNQLAPPYGSAHPILFSVLPSVGGNATVSWTPSAADFPKTLGPSVPGCLFAQIEVLPNPPTYPGDSSALTNWSPIYQLCGQHNIHIVT
jgi:hypothetical protein